LPSAGLISLLSSRCGGFTPAVLVFSSFLLFFAFATIVSSVCLRRGPFLVVFAFAALVCLYACGVGLALFS
jgi:hypothetical protein